MSLQIVGGTQTIQDILDEIKNSEYSVLETPGKLIKLKADPVVLACAGYRMYQENSLHRWMDFDQVVVWQDDVEQAERLKAYYRNQFKETTFRMLKSTTGKGLSSFRRKLYLLATGDLPITDKEIGLLHRLPYFYAEDLALDEIVQATKSVEYVPAHNQTLNLTLFKKVLRSRSAGETNQYWFLEQSNCHAYMLPVKTDNNLANFFDSQVNRPLNLESVVICKQMQGRSNHVYFQLAAPRIV